MPPFLSACPSCARHVRVTEPSCPFCAAALGDDFRARRPPRAPIAGLSRAALFAFGASAAVGGCSSSSSPAAIDGGPIDAGTVTADAAAFDASTLDDAGHVGEPVYGAPVHFDGGDGH